MKGAALITRLSLICLMLSKTTSEAESGVVQSGCGDAHLWIQVPSAQTPQFQAVDENGVHSISSEVAARCGYTISTFTPGFTSLRASYYSCFTHNQKDEVFRFRFNVLLNDGGNSSSFPLSAVCPTPLWTHREILCEENYMEVTVNSEDWRGHRGGMEVPTLTHQWEDHSSSYQLMFQRSDLQILFMSLMEAEREGFTLSSSNQRTVFRSGYHHPQAELEEVEGVSVEVLRVFLVYREKLVMMMMDMSVSCPVNGEGFDGSRLLWDVPTVLPTLLQDGAHWEGGGVGVGLENELLDKEQVVSRGLSLVQEGGRIRVRIPLGVAGGYRKSLVENNAYKERYGVLLQYQHISSLLYDHGSRLTTRHRTWKVLVSPLICHPAFTVNNTVWQQHVFTVILGNIPTDVKLQEVTINGKTAMSAEGFRLHPLPVVNGSQSYELQLPFDHHAVHWMYLGGGVVQYSMELNFTLTLLNQNQSYYHLTTITATALDAFPPQITAQCSDTGISFSVIPADHAPSVWEVGIQHRPLTPELVESRGYRLDQHHNRTTLVVPLFSVGFTYQGINLSSFFGTFQLLLRDARSLEVQTSTTKSCLFRTQDMIVCSSDGTVTLVATLTGSRPLVPPHRTRLRDSSCGPKQANKERVLFEFKLDSCGTRATVGDWFLVYENEILFERRRISDGPNVISRDSEFRMTARCFYPLTSVLRLFVDQRFNSDGYGFISKGNPSKTMTQQITPPQVHPHPDWSLVQNLPEVEEEQTSNLNNTHFSKDHPTAHVRQNNSSSQLYTRRTGNQQMLPQLGDNSLPIEQSESETSNFSPLDHQNQLIEGEVTSKKSTIEDAEDFTSASEEQTLTFIKEQLFQ